MDSLLWREHDPAVGFADLNSQSRRYEERSLVDCFSGKEGVLRGESEERRTD
jgi:hypothetical protein